MHPFTPERGVFGTFGKEVFERDTQLYNRHLRRVLGYFQHPRELLAFHPIQLPTQCSFRRFGK
jgi:hypothetical protein